MLDIIKSLFKSNYIKYITGAVVGAGATHTVNETKTEVAPQVHVYHIESAPIHFYQWFNELRKQNPGILPHKIDSAGFVSVFNNISKFSYHRGSSLTLQEFLCYFFTMYNETGGLFKSISERGDDAYFFDNRAIGIGWKMSYNTLRGNIPAGDYMYSLGIIKDSVSRKQWNSQNYPLYASGEVKLAARNCDFYKYRGQGLIQLTGRYNFDRFVKPLIPNVHELTWWQLANEFKKPEIYLPSIRNYLSIHPSKMVAINKDEPEWDVFGHLISGRAKYHYFSDRCTFVYNEILNEGFYKIFYPDVQEEKQDSLVM